MFIHYETKEKMSEIKGRSAKAEYFRGSLKGREDLSFLKHKEENPGEFKQRSTIHKMEYSRFIPHSTKN
jgi:hypothetical protein